MANEVYANGNEIAAKSGTNKVIASFPDVCLSPPPPPAGPLPVPYPNSSFSKDLQEGSQTVMLGGKPAALAQQSFYNTSPLGDEAATRTFGANVITHQITGKTYFQAWSFDVKIEGKNVCRHLDITTSNHASNPPGNPTPNPGTSKPGRGGTVPPGCPDAAICKFKDEPEPGPHGSLDDADKDMCSKARGEPESQQRGTVAEVRALRHNRKNKPLLKEGKDVECLWECTACNKKFEIDQVVRDDDDKIVAIVEVKSGGPLRSPQAGIHSALAAQKGIRSVKKVQHKTALKKCKDNGLDHIDINPEPPVAL